MLYTHCTEKLLGLQGVKVTNIEESETTITVFAEMERNIYYRAFLLNIIPRLYGQATG